MPKRFYAHGALSLKFVKQVVHVLAVILAEAGIQMPLKFLDSGSPPAFAGVARNDD